MLEDVLERFAVLGVLLRQLRTPFRKVGLDRLVACIQFSSLLCILDGLLQVIRGVL